jgi:hypothetical protein
MKKISSVFLLMLITVITSWGQHSTTLYYMTGIPQKTFVNPALQPDARIFMGVPGISMLNIQSGNTGFSFNDLMTKTDTSFSPDMDKMLNRMPRVGNLYTNVYYQPIAFGFGFLKKGYFTFAMAPVFNLEFYYPRDLFGLVWKGNGHPDYLGKRISWDGMGLEMSLTNEISLGYSHQITKRLTVGARYRYINGLANIYTERFNAGITTDSNTFAMSIDLDTRINASAPFINFDSITSFQMPDYSTQQWLDQSLDYLKKSSGSAIDIGVTYMLLKRIFLSASVNNIGSITWAGNPFSLQTKGNFNFNGMDVSGLINGDSTEQFDPQVLLDSLMNSFSMDTLREKYIQPLNPSVNLGAAFYLSKDDAFGFLWRNQFYHGVWYPKMTLSYNHQFLRILSVSGTYDIERGSYKNFGAGIALKLGPVQYYLITDNALAFAFPLDAKKIHIVTGMNWLIGNRTKKESGSSL